MKQETLEKWLNKKIEEAKSKGDEMFLGVPDAWYEHQKFCCNNGHISTMYLKSEMKGSLCLGCYEPSHIFPTGVTEEEFHKALGIINKTE